MKKNRLFYSVCEVFFALAIVSAMLHFDYACLILTAVAWTPVVLKLRSIIIRRKPILGEVIAVGMLVLLYPIIFFLVVGFADDLTQLLKGIWLDFVELSKFPILTEMYETVQRVAKELWKATTCVSSLRKTGDLAVFKTVKWSFHYLLLGVVGFCLLLPLAVRYVYYLLTELPGCVTRAAESLHAAAQKAAEDKRTAKCRQPTGRGIATTNS